MFPRSWRQVAEAYRERGTTSEGASERSCPPRTKLRPPVDCVSILRFLRFSIFEILDFEIQDFDFQIFEIFCF